MNEQGGFAIWRWLALGAVILMALALTGAALARALGEQQRQQRPTAQTARDRALDLATVRALPHLIFRSTAPGPTYGLVAAVPLKDPGGPRAVSTTACERVYATATQGVCLAADRGVVTTYSAKLLDGMLKPGRRLPLDGIPSRARLSADGSRVATTTFVSGHSYLDVGFSTQTLIADVGSRHSYGSIERFRTTIDGEVTTAADLNVWGVSFLPGPTPAGFYATVSTGGHTWLVRGDLGKRTLTSVHTDAECPSLSPDGHTVVYKKRAGNAITWRLHAMEVATGREWPLPETRSVDDQIEWLDDEHVVYGLPRAGSAQTDVWVSGLHDGRPSVLVPNAWSPAVVH